MTVSDPGERQMHNEDNVTYQNIATVSGGLLSEIKPEQRANALRGAQLLAKALQAEGGGYAVRLPRRRQPGDL